MLATSDRVKPCSARCSPRSVGRVTTICSPSWATVMSLGMRSPSVPRGPLTDTNSGSMETVTPAGSGMGFLPMRDMALPDVRHDLAADARVAGLVAGHDASGRGDDRGAHAAEHLRDLARAGIRAAARTRDAPQAGDRRAAIRRVLQPHADDLAGVVGVGCERLVAVDVALLGEDSRALRLELGRWDVDRLVGGLDRVADPGEEIGDGVGAGAHGFSVLLGVTTKISSCPGR